MKQIFKYIIVDSGAILFNEQTIHFQVASGFIDNEQKIYSAGFCEVTFHHTISPTVRAFGESISLNIKSNPILDTPLIEDLFNPISQLKYNGGRIFGLTIKEYYENFNKS